MLNSWAGMSLYREAKPLSYPVEGWSKFKAVAEETDSGEHIQTQPSSRHRHNQTTHIPGNTEVIGWILCHYKHCLGHIVAVNQPMHTFSWVGIGSRFV